MKKLFRPFIKGTNWALAGLMALLGITACGDTAAEYGSPYAKFTVKGSVVDEDGAPVRGIGVYPGQDVWHSLDTTYTDQKGEFEVTYELFTGDKIKLMIEDVDGVANGSFRKDSVTVTFTRDDYYEKGSGWYQGAARKEIDPITLKEED